MAEQPGGSTNGVEFKTLPARSALPLFDAGVSVMIVDALVVFRLDLVPGDLRTRVEFERHVADKVFYENGVFVGPLSDRFFVLALQQRVQIAAGRTFNDRNQIFDPDGSARTNPHSHDAPL